MASSTAMFQAPSAGASASSRQCQSTSEFLGARSLLTPGAGAGPARLRRASPSRLVPKTARLMAAPGKRTSHGAFWAYSDAETDSIRPQEGYGSGTPRPRKDSAASTRMALPKLRRGENHEGPDGVRQDVPEGHAEMADAQGAGRLHVGRLADRQDARSDDASRPRDDRDRDGDDDVGKRWAQRADMTRARTRSGKPCRMSMTRWVTRSVMPPA